jgi:hypothetical protein
MDNVESCLEAMLDPGSFSREAFAHCLLDELIHGYSEMLGDELEHFICPRIIESQGKCPSLPHRHRCTSFHTNSIGWQMAGTASPHQLLCLLTDDGTNLFGRQIDKLIAEDGYRGERVFA